MGKTIRRKNSKPDYLLNYHDPMFDHNEAKWYWRNHQIKYMGKEHQRRIARYFSDAGTTMNQAPSWYRKMLNRKFRRKNSHILVKIQKGHDKEFIPFKKNLLWLWW